MNAQQELDVTVETVGALAIVKPTGRLDLATFVLLRDAVHKVLTTQPTAVAVDLSRLVVADDLALTVFSAAARAAEAWPGCRVLLYAPDPKLRGVLGRMSITRFVPTYSHWSDLLVGARPIPPRQRYTRRLAAHPGATAIARELVATVCQEWDLAPLVADAELIVTELVSNAVRYVGGDIMVAVVVSDYYLHISVRDGSTEPPRRRTPDPDAGGRGLLLVEAMAAAWGSTVTDGGKVVWATLALPRD